MIPLILGVSIPDHNFSPKPTVTLDNTTRSSVKHCDANYADFHYEITILIVFVVCFIIGLVYSFFGYRFYKAVLFLTGFLFGSILIYMVCDSQRLVPVLASAAIAICAGILFGLVTMLVQYVGLFMSGFLTGLFVGLIAMLLLVIFYTPTSVWMTIGTFFCSGLALALVTLKWQRCCLVVSTSLIGGALVASSVDYVAAKFMVVTWMWRVIRLDPVEKASKPACWYSWVILAIWPLIFTLGFLIQYRITSVGYDHKTLALRRIYRKRTGRTPLSPSTAVPDDHIVDQNLSGGCKLRANDHGDLPKSSFRYVYRARRLNGDVICQSYMDNLRRIVDDSKRQTTLSSDHSQLTSVTRASESTAEPVGLI